jgi:hypothetical protein
MELENELRTGHVSLEGFYALFSQRLPFLGHIKINAVQVVNHLGDVIPVPDVFCSTWKVFFILSASRSADTPREARIFIISSMVIAKSASEITSSSGVTIK